MKNKYLIFVFPVLFSISANGQENNNIAKLTTQCSLIVEYSQQLEQSKNSCDSTENKICILRGEWKKTCLDYIASDSQTAEDFQYLIDNTDQVNESDLYNQLVEASKHIKSAVNNPKSAGKTYPVDSTKSVFVDSDNDGKVSQKDKDKDEKKQSTTISVKEDNDDIGGDMKSVIEENKGKNK